MTVTVRAVSSVESTSATKVIPVPTGTLDGDLMILATSNSAEDNGYTVPAGWLRVPHFFYSPAYRLFYRIAHSEPVDYTFTMALGGQSAIAIISLYSSVGDYLKFDAYAKQSNASNTNREFPSITMSAAGLLLCLGGLPASNTPDASMTERWDIVSTPRLYLMTQSVSSGATGTRTATGTAGVSNVISFGVIESSTPMELFYPDVRSRTTIAAVSAAGTQTITKPAGVADGDLLIWGIYSELTDFTPTMPAGWTAITGATEIAATYSLRLYSRVADSEPADYTATWTGTRVSAMSMVAFRSPQGWPQAIDVVAKTTQTGLTTYTYPAVTTTKANALLYMVKTHADNVLTAMGVNHIQIYDIAGNDPAMIGSIAWQDAAGLSGTYTDTSSTAEDAKLATIAIYNPEPTPSAPTGLSAVGVTDERIDLTWTDTSPYARTVSIERSDDGSTGWAEIATVDDGIGAYSDTGLDAGVTYYYRVRALVVAVYSTYSAIDSGDTFPGILAPTTFDLTVIHPRKIRLTWTDPNIDEEGVSIERSGSGVGGWTEVGTVEPNVLTYTDTGLTPNSTYYYRARAYKSS